MAYCDYDFYRNVYLGNAISAEDFPQLSERASDYIRAATKGISDTVDGGQLEAVKKCTCAVADVLLDESIMTASAYSGKAQVSSETVGPWSRSFKTPGGPPGGIQGGQRPEKRPGGGGRGAAVHSLFGVRC